MSVAKCTGFNVWLSSVGIKWQSMHRFFYVLLAMRFYNPKCMHNNIISAALGLNLHPWTLQWGEVHYRPRVSH